jgi:hypothetical protein
MIRGTGPWKVIVCKTMGVREAANPPGAVSRAVSHVSQQKDPAEYAGRQEQPFQSQGLKLLSYWCIASALIPMLEKPPSWKRFCIVTFLVRSENRVMQ